ncbi:MAG: T9SS type A sorting domain-containing protein [Bacteroidia bacterium]
MKFKTLFTVILSFSSIYGYNQCLDLSDSTIEVQFADTVELDFGEILDSEYLDSSELEITVSTNEGDKQFNSFYQVEWNGDNPKIYLSPYAKGVYQTTISRRYYIDGALAKYCFSGINIHIKHENDQRFDTISNGHITVGTGTGSMPFTDTRKGLFKVNGFEIEMFSNLYGGTSFLVGGIDSENEIHLSGHAYLRNQYSEASFGPEGVSATNNERFNRVWKVRSYRLFENDYDLLPINYIDSNNNSSQLLKYVDVDSNGLWNSEVDYPCVFGDEMLYTSYHYNKVDKDLFHQGKQLPVRVNQFLFLSNEAGLEKVLFGRLEVTNYSDETFNNVHIGLFSDLVGYGYDITKNGCDTALNLFYSYITEPKASGQTFAGKEPALGVVFLNENLSSYVTYFKSVSPVCANLPRDRTDFYKYLSGKTQGGGAYYDHKFLCDSTKGKKVTTHLFPGDPFLDTIKGGMHMNTDKVQSNHYYSVGGSGPFELKPNETITFDVAWVVGFDGKSTGMENLKAMKEQAKRAQDHYQQNGFACRLKDELSIEEADGPSFNVYPNPSNGIVNVETEENGRLEIYSSTGKLQISHEIKEGASQLSLDLANGIYLVVLTTDKGIKTEKLTID